MIRAAVGLALASTACWTGEVKPPDPPAHYALGKPRKTPPHKSIALTPPELARQLATDLRNDGAMTLLRAVDGAVVLFETDADQFTTLCDRRAELATEQWATLLADPGRPEPGCAPTGNEHYACRQFARAAPWLALDFTRDELGFRLVDAVIGVPTPTSIGTMRAKLAELQAQVAGAHCP